MVVWRRSADRAEHAYLRFGEVLVGKTHWSRSSPAKGRFRGGLEKPPSRVSEGPLVDSSTFSRVTERFVQLEISLVRRANSRGRYYRGRRVGSDPAENKGLLYTLNITTVLERLSLFSTKNNKKKNVKTLPAVHFTVTPADNAIYNYTTVIQLCNVITM